MKQLALIGWLFAAMFTAAESAHAGGTWGSQVGGSLKRYFVGRALDDFLLPKTFERAEFYRVYKDAGLGIEHEYLGIKTVWRSKNGSYYEKIFTTGLVDTGDELFFIKSLNANTDNLAKVAEFSDRKQFEAVVKRFNRTMANHPANVACRLTFRMIATPVFGQPCTNAVEMLLELI
jgi:hypothetical protein